MTDGSAQIDLLRYRDNAHPSLAPIGEQIDAIAQPTGKPVQFPNYDGFDPSLEDSSLYLSESQPIGRGSTFFILKPPYRGQIDWVAP